MKDQVRQQLAASAGRRARAGSSAPSGSPAAHAAPATALSDNTLVVSRAQPRDLPRPLLDAVLKAPSATLPAFVGVDLGAQGYAVVQDHQGAGAAIRPSAIRRKGKGQYAQVWADAEAQAYYAALKTRFKVTINESALTRATARPARRAEPRSPYAGEPSRVARYNLALRWWL